MELDYICTGTEDMKPIRWNGHINLLKLRILMNLR